MGARADNNEGSCRQALSGPKAGKWRVQHTVLDALGRKRRISRLFARQADGKEFLRGLKRQDRVEAASVARGTTLAEWIDWLAEHDRPEELAERTVEDRVACFRKYARPVFGDVPLAWIDPTQVRAYYRRLRTQGVGQPTILAIKRDLVRAFNQAANPYQRVPPTLLPGTGNCSWRSSSREVAWGRDAGPSRSARAGPRKRPSRGLLPLGIRALPPPGRPPGLPFPTDKGTAITPLSGTSAPYIVPRSKGTVPTLVFHGGRLWVYQWTDDKAPVSICDALTDGGRAHADPDMHTQVASAFPVGTTSGGNAAWVASVSPSHDHGWRVRRLTLESGVFHTNPLQAASGAGDGRVAVLWEEHAGMPAGRLRLYGRGFPTNLPPTCSS